jgi:hypothetical protein
MLVKNSEVAFRLRENSQLQIYLYSLFSVSYIHRVPVIDLLSVFRCVCSFTTVNVWYALRKMCGVMTRRDAGFLFP